MSPVVDNGGDRSARRWARISGVFFVVLALDLLLTAAAWGGGGIDLRSIVLPWTAIFAIAALWLLLAVSLRVILPVAALLGVGSAAYWGVFALGSTYPGSFALVFVLSLAAGLAALQGRLRLSSPRP